MKVVPYTDKYYMDVVNIVKNFHEESIHEYDGVIDIDSVIDTITTLEGTQSENAFLLVVDDTCQGILAGIEMKSLYNKKRIFQEIIWYVNEPFRRYGVWLLNKVQEILRERGVNTLIMALMENSKTEKLKSLYKTMGFQQFEIHYIKGL